VLSGFKQMCWLSAGGVVRCTVCSCRALVQPVRALGMWAGWRDVEGRPWRGGTPRSQGRRDRGESTSGCGGRPGMSRAGLLARLPPCSCFTNQYVIPAGWVQPDLCGAEATRRRWPGDCRSALTLRRTTRPRMASREGVDTVPCVPRNSGWLEAMILGLTWGNVPERRGEACL
jgi:hypothetical protein